MNALPPWAVVAFVCGAVLVILTMALHALATL